MKMMKRERVAGLTVMICVGFGVMFVSGGSLDSPAPPTDPASAMYTAQDIYNRLAYGTNAQKRAGAFTEPTTAPSPDTMVTADDIMSKAPAQDNVSGAAPSDVLSGKTFWGLTQGAWGTHTGTMANQANLGFMPGPDNVSIPSGFYNGSGVITGDAALVTGNIKKDVEIFGVMGSYEDTSARVPKTGQTTSYRTGDDGEHKKGIAWPDPRFAVTTNGTHEVVTDNMTGLMWVKAPHALDGNSAEQNWDDAIDFCNALSFAGHTDWRLPNARELHSLTDHGQFIPALPSGHPFTDIQSVFYCSSSTYAIDTSQAWYVHMAIGGIVPGEKTATSFVWPVRGGQ